MASIMFKKCFPPEGWQLLKKLGPLHEQHSAILAGGTALALQIGHRGWHRWGKSTGGGIVHWKPPKYVDRAPFELVRYVEV